MSWKENDAIFGDVPEPGDLVYVDFGDSVSSDPEVKERLVYIGEKGVALEGTRRYNWVEIAHIEVIEKGG